MITDSDTAKWDISLLIAGILGLALFFWLYSENHPLSVADNSFGEAAASIHSSEILQNFGYTSDPDPFTSYKVNKSLLDSIQKQHNFHGFYSSHRNREVFPVFYWNSEFKIERLERDGSFNFGGPQARIIAVQLFEDGGLKALKNSSYLLPEKNIDAEALSYALGDIMIPVSELRADTLIYEKFHFQFDGQQRAEQIPESIDPEGSNYFGRSIAEKLGEYYLDKSGWPADRFEVKSVEKSTIRNVDAARVVYHSADRSMSHMPELRFEIMPTGVLVAFNYYYPDGANSLIQYEEIKTGIRIIILLLGAFWIIILLFIRFRLRLVDINGAILIAVLAGFIFPFITLMSMLREHLHAFGVIDLSYLIIQLITLGVVAAFASIGFFIVSAISDSITRERWAEKLRTIDLIRIGHFVNKPLGLTLIRGISYSFILSGLFALLLFLTPGSYISLEADFIGDASFLPNITVPLVNLAIYFVISQAVFLIFIGYFRSRFRSSWVLLLLTIFAFLILNPLPVRIGGITSELVMAGSLGLFAGIIYIREDFLTTFLSLFLFALITTSAGGWLISQSPDAGVFYSVAILTTAGFIYGGYAVYRGRSTRELPVFVPQYIDELAQEERIKQELQIARKVQQSFLPASTPDIEGLDISAVCKPAYETGGDYYDFISLDGDKLAVAIGDVSGKGIQAAFFMTFTKGVLHALCNDFFSTIQVLTKTNKMFRNNASRGTFISLIFGIVDLKTSQFKFSRAGHNPLLYFDSAENKLHIYQPEGIAIGMAADDVFKANITEQIINFKKDDIIFLFTDGVVEAISKTNKVYGDERLQGLIRRNHKLSAGKLMQKIEEDIQEFVQTPNQHDDLTMLIIKKR